MTKSSYTYALIGLLVLIVIVAVGLTFVQHSSAPAGQIQTVSEASPAGQSVVQTALQTGSTGSSQIAAAAVAVGQSQQINWQTSSYPSANVNVSIIRKTSSNPNTYELVRVIAASAPNTGSLTWTPAAGDIGNNTYVEIGCVNSTSACQASISSSPLSVTN